MVIQLSIVRNEKMPNEEREQGIIERKVAEVVEVIDDEGIYWLVVDVKHLVWFVSFSWCFMY